MEKIVERTVYEFDIRNNKMTVYEGEWKEEYNCNLHKYFRIVHTKDRFGDGARVFFSYKQLGSIEQHLGYLILVLDGKRNDDIAKAKLTQWIESIFFNK